MKDKNRDALFYQEAYGYLLTVLPPSLDEEELNNVFLEASKSDYETLDDVFERMIASVVNLRGMSNVIGYGGKNRERILDVIGNGDGKPSVAVVANMDYDELYEKLKTRVGYEHSDSKKNSWRKFSRSTVDCARFLKPFKDRDGFFNFVEGFTRSESVPGEVQPYLRLALPMMIQQKVYGIGFALACDFLKELGFDCYPKPDTHLTDVFSELDLVDASDQYSVYEAIVRAAQNATEITGVRVSPYRLDKIVYLICSGKFDQYAERSVSHKSDFISFMKERLSVLEEKVNIVELVECYTEIKPRGGDY